MYTCGACSKTCGGGTRSCARSVTTYSSNGGSACPVLTKTEACNTGACPAVNCAVSAYTCGTCSKTCGGGTQSCSRTVTTASSNEGSACPALSKTETCNSGVCASPAAAVNCTVSAYTCGGCSKTCGGGTQSCSRSVTTAASNGGSACPALSKTEACNTGVCASPAAVNCVVSVYACGGCSKTCAGGTQSCSRSATTASSNGGAACPALSKTEACNTGVCPSTASLTVTANLTLASDVMGADDAAAFKLKILPTIAAAAGVDQSAVSLNVVVSSRRRARGLLAAAVNVDVNVTYGVDATPATRQLATDKAVAFMSKASYMTSMLLPAAMANTAHAGVTTLNAPAAVGLTCPPVKTYADASTLVGPCTR
jgi:hypothetical protein